jgi:tRNA (mo5U34)-methyltransferase
MSVREISGTDREQIQSRVRELGPWFHNLELPGGIQTNPEHPLGADFPARKWREVAPHLPASIAGWTVLDVGCNAGFYSMELARRGARVLAIDSDERYLAQASWAARVCGVADAIEFRQMQLYDLAHTGESFDLVWFMGVFYHLRYPLLGLDIVARAARRMVVFQTLTMPGEEVCSESLSDSDIEDRSSMLLPGWPKMAFIEHSFFNDPTNWWAPNHAAVEAMLRSAGLRVVHRPGHEIYVCDTESGTARVLPWQTAEFHAATGQRFDDRSMGAA